MRVPLVRSIGVVMLLSVTASAEPVQVEVEGPYQPTTLAIAARPSDHFVCLAPCKAQLDTTQTYRAWLDGQPSSTFTIEPKTTRIKIGNDDSRASTGLGVLGGGALFIIIGIGVARYGGDGLECTNQKTTGCTGDILMIGGAILMGIGALLVKLPSRVTATQQHAAP